MKRLTIQEEEAMLYIWRKFPCTIKSVLEMYPENHKIPYTTLASIFKNLQSKKYIRVNNKSFPYTFEPIIQEEEYKHKFMKGFVNNYFSNSFKGMASFFAEHEELSKEDLQDILKMIEDKES